MDTYSSYWKNLGSILLYRDNSFQYKSDIIITDINCLIKPITFNDIYKHNKDFELIDTDVIRKFKRDYSDKSIIVICNHINNNKLNVDLIKRKVEFISSSMKISIMYLIALKPNKFMKPHTGLYSLLKAYYKQFASKPITSTLVVGINGGKIKDIITPDTDRAFANNINGDFLLLEEYIDDIEINSFEWCNGVIPPEIRAEYKATIEKYTNPDVFKTLSELRKNETYMIIVVGAPCSGKTTFCRELISKWRKSEYGKTHEIHRVSDDIYKTKNACVKKCNEYLSDRISVIIDGMCYDDITRSKYLALAKKYSTPVLHIDVDVGLSLAKVFNHVRVEKSKDPDECLYSDNIYDIYKSMYQKINLNNEDKENKYILIRPRIKECRIIDSMRF